MADNQESKLTHIRVELTANEGEYAAFDTNEDMLGETFAFQRDAGVFRLEVYIDGVANEKYAEKLSDNEIFTDYEDFNLQWGEEFEVVKRFDNIAVYSWDFDVEDFDIAKLQLIFTCYDVVLESSDYSEEGHCPVLKYDGQEIEQNEILSKNKDCEEIWNLWEQLDADEDCEDEDWEDEDCEDED
ncbi:MAG: hypothetical protein IKV22_02710 [Paludibacteraceae bacterium]|nr:hypothetical protein [Paludibacteraceae bacterium]